MKQIPKDLTLRLEQIFSKEEFSTLTRAAEQERRAVSFRVNTLKSNISEITEALEKYNIKYTLLEFPIGCIILDAKHKESEIWKLKIYKEGKIYMQGISSQIATHYFSTSDQQLKILDACSAPGGKASQLSAPYPDSKITAFEPHRIRLEKMQHNLKKLGCDNIKTIRDESRNISKHIEEENYFDMILVDAPCSSEGSISIHNEKFLEAWDISHIKKNYKRQKHIIDDVLPYLKNSGELIYATCTLAPEENEAVVHYILCNYPQLELQKIELPDSEYISTKQPLKTFGKYIYKSEISEKAIRIVPSVHSEGFFIAKFIKKEGI